eukprot:6179001-Pleurochrysis_carterae.AAC.2
MEQRHSIPLITFAASLVAVDLGWRSRPISNIWALEPCIAIGRYGARWRRSHLRSALPQGTSRCGGSDQRGAVSLSQWAPRPAGGAARQIPLPQPPTMLWGRHLNESPVG